VRFAISRRIGKGVEEVAFRGGRIVAFQVPREAEAHLRRVGGIEAQGIFKRPHREGWLRLALVHPVADLEAGAARIGAWLATL
jgi:hypothetical protein